MNPSIEKKIAAGFGVAVLVLLLTVAAVAWNASRFNDMFRRVDHTHEVLNLLGRVSEGVLRMQAGARGFALTGAEDMAASYERGHSSAGLATRELRWQTTDNPLQQRALDNLEPELAEVIRLLESRIAARRARGFDAAREAGEFVDGQVAVERVIQIVQTMADEERHLLAKRRERTQSAALRTVEASTVISGVAVAFLIGAGWLVRRDFRQRMRSEAALRKSQRMFQQLFKDSPDALILVNASGDIVHANLRAETMFGWENGELNGRKVAQLLPERFHESHDGHLTRYFAAPRPRPLGTGLELVGRRKDASEFPVEAMLSPLETDEGLQTLAVIRDITERRAADEKIRRLNLDLQLQNARLEIANKELESFSYSVSHDLRAPLRHIDGFAGLLAKHAAGVLDEKGTRFLTVISEAARRMGRLIDDLLAFSRTGRAPIALGVVDNDLAVRGVIREHGLDRDPRIEWQIGPLPAVRADAAMLRQVWANLLENAVKYSSRSPAPRIEIGSLPGDAGNAEHIFFVRDNGVGFDMKYASKLFGVFQRLHSEAEFEGTGIGLANVRRIITRHGGRTWAEGQLDHGATFYFSLPHEPA